MKKFKISAILYYAASLCWYIAAIISFTSESSRIGVIWLCLGSSTLCLGSDSLNKYRKEKNNSDKSDDKDKPKE